MSDLARYWPATLPASLRETLEAAYADPARSYHDRQHLGEVLAHVDELLPADDPARVPVLLAAWFHDAVYVGRGDDEERSAQLALSSLGDTDLGREVARLVRLTAAHRPADDDHAGQVLCDADLGILAATPDRYASYARGVRKEYAHVPDAAFAAGRAAVLRDLLAKPTMFHTDRARERWEATARANVEAELARLAPVRLLVVDGANVVGSRPDGWWRDRSAAARRLSEQLLAADLDRDVVLVLEGAARRGVPAGAADRLTTVHAPESGDDTIVEVARSGVADGSDVTVVTADRELRARVEAVGASTVGPSWLLDRL
jgi:predicted metal-dependent HD superfamily phosphohydrolase